MNARFVLALALAVACSRDKPRSNEQPGSNVPAAPGDAAVHDAGAADAAGAAPPVADAAVAGDAGDGAEADFDCAEPCTDYAVCWEQVFGDDFRGGASCVDMCEDWPIAERRAWAKKVAEALRTETCKTVVE